jgi:hypothetical protein
MSSGGWPIAGPRHGRHRHGHVNSAWTPAVRPTETGRLPSHGRFPWGPPHPAGEIAPLVPLQREPGNAVVHAVPETPPRGLRKFDLGIVPASVTPPRSWRRAAWFAVGTAAAVVCGLAVAAVRLVGTPPSGETIEALPAFPTQQLGTLPAEETTRGAAPTTSRPSSSSPSVPAETPRQSRESARPDAPSAAAFPAGSTTSGPAGTWSEPAPPPRTTVGPQPVTPTDPQAMGDRTEAYFALVTVDPRAAHEMCTGSLGSEGPEGIEARYAGVDHVEVRDMTIDRNHAVTTSTVKVVREDGTEAVEQRQLRFTWGGDPKISGDTSAG